jgi:hypothetical protein
VVGLGLAPLAVAAILVMNEISRLLASLAVADEPSYGASALTGWPEFLFWQDDQRIKAIEVWAKAAPELPGDGRVLVLNWIRIHLYLDIFLFTPAYCFCIYLLLHKIWKELGKRKRPEPPPVPAKWVPGISVSVLVFDWCETILTCVLVGDLGCRGLPGQEPGCMPSEELADAVSCFSALKWVAIVLAVVSGILVFAVRIFPAKLMRWLGYWKRGSSQHRVWTRHRNQLGVLVMLALVAVWPGEGPLEQTPDIARAWVDNGSILVGDVLAPITGLFFFCLALWVAGRWALLDGAPRERRSARVATLWVLFIVAVVLGTLAGLLVGVTDWATPGALAIPVMILAVALVSLVLRRHWKGQPFGKTQAPKGARRRQVRTVGRVLAVVPFTIAGLGLARAYARPLLLGPNVAERDGRVERLAIYPEVIAGFCIGLAVALLAAPAANAVLRLIEECWFEDRKVEEQAPKLALGRKNARYRVPFILGWCLLAAALVMGMVLAYDPLEWGPRFRSLGVLVLVLATVVLIGGLLVRHSETSVPLPAFQYLRFRHTPIWLLLATALVLEAQLDTAGGYHEVRLLKPSGTQADAPAEALNAQQYFDTWLTRANSCLDREKTLKEASAIPMLFVAAPGGGIRAAYWTGSAMDRITRTPCASSMIFGTSGVSGGSLGLIGYALAQQTQPRKANGGRDFASRLASEDALSANLAAWFYRDLPRGLHGINTPDDEQPIDRAAVFERAWEQVEPRLEGDFFAETRPTTGADHAWRPLMLLNGTDVDSGCRVVISPFLATGGPRDDSSPSLNCKRAEVAATAGDGHKEVDSSGFAAAAIEAAAFTDHRDCRDGLVNQSLRLSTAAHLSARFPYISPTGTMHRCVEGKEVQSTADLDGGLLEGSGLSVLLELWPEFEAVVARHNRAITHGREGRYVLPLIAVVDNHYQSMSAAPQADRHWESTAPLAGRQAAPRTALSETTLEQTALLRFSGPLPGIREKTQIRIGKMRCPSVRSFLVAPRDRPDIAAPLGWVLSGMSMEALTRQLNDAAAPPGSECRAPNAKQVPRSGTRPDDSKGREPIKFSTLLALIKGPVDVDVPHECHHQKRKPDDSPQFRFRVMKCGA